MKPGRIVEPARVDHLRVGRDLHLPVLADRLEPPVFDDDDGILNGRTAGAVDQRSTLHHQRLTGHFPRRFFLSYFPSFRGVPKA